MRGAAPGAPPLRLSLVAIAALGALGCRVALNFSGSDGGSSSTSRCIADQDCPLPALHCDDGLGQCFACVRDSDCSTDAGPSARCDTARHLCVQCGVAGDCGPSGWRCLSGTCVQSCASNTDCTLAGTHCDDGICEQCDDYERCSGALTYCDSTIRRCVGCTSDGQCAAPTQRCHPTLERCVACVTSSDCSGDLVCNPADWTCEMPRS